MSAELFQKAWACLVLAVAMEAEQAAVLREQVEALLRAVPVAEALYRYRQEGIAELRRLQAQALVVLHPEEHHHRAAHQAGLRQRAGRIRLQAGQLPAVHPEVVQHQAELHRAVAVLPTQAEQQATVIPSEKLPIG